MRVFSLLLSLFVLLLPLWGAEVKKTYVAKSKKGVKYGKKAGSRKPVRYPVKVNTSVNAEDLKLNQMIRDIYE